MTNDYTAEILERGLMPKEIEARPFGAPRIVRTPEPDDPNLLLDPHAPLPLLTEDQINDKLRQIAQLLRGLTCEEMWKLTGQMGKPVGFDKELINWAKTYMGEEVEAIPNTTKLQRRG